MRSLCSWLMNNLRDILLCGAGTLLHFWFSTCSLELTLFTDALSHAHAFAKLTDISGSVWSNLLLTLDLRVEEFLNLVHVVWFHRCSFNSKRWLLLEKRVYATAWLLLHRMHGRLQLFRKKLSFPSRVKGLCLFRLLHLLIFDFYLWQLLIYLDTLLSVWKSQIWRWDQSSSFFRLFHILLRLVLGWEWGWVQCRCLNSLTVIL